MIFDFGFRFFIWVLFVLNVSCCSCYIYEQGNETVAKSNIKSVALTVMFLIDMGDCCEFNPKL